MDTGRYQRCIRFCHWFVNFHFKNRGKIQKDLIIFRTLSIILLFAYSIIDTIMYSSTATNKSDALRFLHGSRHLALEILIIIYASGVATFGVSVEIYPLFLHAIVNCILVARNCDSSSMLKTSIIWIFKLFFLFVSVELCHRNFRKLRGYNERFNSSSHAVLRQALIFSVTMMFLSSSGFSALYYAINKSLLHPCVYKNNACAIVDLYVPLFTNDDDKCVSGLTSYVAGREQLRVLRNYMLLNGVAYSIFNVNFLKIRRKERYLWLRIIVVILFIALSTSFLFSSIDPFFFIYQCQLVYSIIECLIFVIMLSLLSFNLYKLRNLHPSPSSQQPPNSTVTTPKVPQSVRKGSTAAQANYEHNAEDLYMTSLPELLV